MKRLTQRRMNGIKTGYWSVSKKDDLLARLAEYEDTGLEPEEVLQAAKYTEYLEVLLGEDYDVIPCLVLTKADDLYCHVPLGESDALLPVCSGNMLFNLFDEYMGFLDK